MNKWARCDKVLDAHRDDGWVLFQSESGAFCDLDAIGAEVWNLLADPIAIPDMVGQLTRRFAVDAETCTRDVTAFLGDLSAKGFVVERS